MLPRVVLNRWFGRFCCIKLFWAPLGLDPRLHHVERACHNPSHTTRSRSGQNLQPQPYVAATNPILRVSLLLLIECELER